MLAAGWLAGSLSSFALDNAECLARWYVPASTRMNGHVLPRSVITGGVRGCSSLERGLLAHDHWPESEKERDREYDGEDPTKVIMALV